MVSVKWWFAVPIAALLLVGNGLVGSAESGSADPDAWVASTGERGVAAQKSDPGDSHFGVAAKSGTGALPPNVRDAGAAAEDPAPPGPDSVIGNDERVQVTPTTSGSAAKTAFITFDGGICSGWFLGADTVVTAGHCVHSGGDDGNWLQHVRVYPGRDGDSAPFGSCGPTRLYSVDGWVEDGDVNYDYGAIKLDCEIGNTVGHFGVYGDEVDLDGQPVSVQGYPGDKDIGTQWVASDRIVRSGEYRLYHQVDTFGGESGGPTYGNIPPNDYCRVECVVAVHARGMDNMYNNSGTRITRDVFDNLLTWRDS